MQRRKTDFEIEVQFIPPILQPQDVSGSDLACKESWQILGMMVLTFLSAETYLDTKPFSDPREDTSMLGIWFLIGLA